MAAPAKCGVITPPRTLRQSRRLCRCQEAARLINQAKRPVVLLASWQAKPENAAAIDELIASRKLRLLDIPAAGAISANLFSSFSDVSVSLIINQRTRSSPRRPGDHDWVHPVEYWPSPGIKAKRTIVHLDLLPADIDNSYSRRLS